MAKTRADAGLNFGAAQAPDLEEVTPSRSSFVLGQLVAKNISVMKRLYCKFSIAPMMGWSNSLNVSKTYDPAERTAF